MNWYLTVLKRYTVFNGRAGRPEYWYFLLFNVIASIALAILDNVLGLVPKGTNVGVLGAIYSLAVILPGIAVAIRRMHDINRSGWWVLISAIPIVGWIIFIIWAARESDAGPNQYGQGPEPALA